MGIIFSRRYLSVYSGQNFFNPFIRTVIIVKKTDDHTVRFGVAGKGVGFIRVHMHGKAVVPAYADYDVCIDQGPAVTLVRTKTSSLSRTFRVRALSGVMWMWRLATITPLEISSSPSGPLRMQPGVPSISPDWRMIPGMPSFLVSVRESSICVSFGTAQVWPYSQMSPRGR